MSTWAVLASGPSMSQAVADQVKHLNCIAVNDTYRLCPWACVIYAADSEWWRQNPQALTGKAGRFSADRDKVPGVIQLRNAGRVGYSSCPDEVHTYSNSGAQAIQIAAKLGARKILLLGFDFHGTHWHGEHKAPLRNTRDAEYPLWDTMMKFLAVELGRRGVDIINCTPGSRLTVFRYGDLPLEA